MKTAEDILNDKDQELICIAPEKSIREALKALLEHGIGALPVKEGSRIVGIWTERDLSRNLLSPGFDIDECRVKEFMTTRLYAASFETTVLKLQEMFLGLFVRHILIEKNHEYIGLLSIGDVMRASLLEKDRQIRKLNAIASWEYYENFGWDHK